MLHRSGDRDVMGGSTTHGTPLDVPDRRRVVVVPAGGRLGNQVFQYSALRSFLGSRSSLWLVDFDEFAATFADPRARQLRSESLLDRMKLAFVDRLAGLPGFGRGEIRQRADSNAPAWVQDGRIAWSGGYYQTPSPGGLEVAEHLHFHPEVKARARRIAGVGPYAFIHVRRGDYLVWPSPEAPAALPDAWYRSGVVAILEQAHSMRFVVVTDDPRWARDVLLPSVADVVSEVTVSDGDVMTDLAIMAGAAAGVLSASTLSWWGAAFASLRGAQGPFLAPERWLGFRGGQWYPHAIAADFLTFVPVATR
jgi:hypothetical protein